MEATSHTAREDARLKACLRALTHYFPGRHIVLLAIKETGNVLDVAITSTAADDETTHELLRAGVATVEVELAKAPSRAVN